MIQMIGIGRLKEMVMAALPVKAEEAHAHRARQPRVFRRKS